MRRLSIHNVLLCGLLTSCGGSDEPVTPDTDTQSDTVGGSDVASDAFEPDVSEPDAVDVVSDADLDSGETDAAGDADETGDVADVSDDSDVADAATPDVTDSVDSDVIDADVTVPLTGVLRGRVTAALTLETEPVAGATVRVGDRETVTDANGIFELTDLPVGVEVTLHVEVEAPTAFFSTMTRTLTLQPDHDGWQTVELLRGCGATVSTAGADGVILLGECGSQDAAIGVTLPANGVVNAAGDSVDNVLVKMAVLPVDVSPGAAVSGMSSFPGDMTAVTETGVEAYIESFGAVEVRLYDAGTGEPVQLAPGATATLQFSAAPSIMDIVFDAEGIVTSIPAWYFDENLGVWVEEGVAQLSVAPFSRRLIFTMDVSHFSWWNADRVAERSCVTGRMVDSRGTALVNQIVLAQGVDYRGATSSTTDLSGRFSVLARASSRVDLVGSAEVLGVRSRPTSRRVETGAAGSACVDVGDVVIDTSSAEACARGRLVTAQGAPLARAEITAFSSRQGSVTQADDTGSFCVPLPVGTSTFLQVSGSLGDSNYRGVVQSFVPEAGTGTCAESTCTGLGDIVVPELGCLAGTVFNETGVQAGAFVSVNTGRDVEVDRSAADGSWCVKIEPATPFELFARGDLSGRGLVTQFTGSSFVPAGGNCGTPSSCQTVELVLGEVGCVSGILLDDVGAPVVGARVAATSQAGGRVSVTTTRADGGFCARALSGDTVLLQYEYFEPGTRYSGVSVVPTSTEAATCGSGGCADAGSVTLAAESFSTCITGRLSDEGRPFVRPVGLVVGDIELSVLPEITGQFCASVPVNDVVIVRDLGENIDCARPREVEVPITTPEAGSCGDISSCLDIGEVDFADFCFSS